MAAPMKVRATQTFKSTYSVFRYVLGKRCASGSTYRPKTLGEDENGFRILVIPGHTPVPEETRSEIKRHQSRSKVPRYKTMDINQDWTNVWPAAQTFKWSVVPFPVRQGYVEGVHENSGIPPGKYANAELMKIPNFLHLTPNHIKKHCNSLKKFCTPWPEDLATEDQCTEYFPVEVSTSDYIKDGHSIRDERARVVTLKIKLSSLELDYHAMDKLKRLAGEKYDPKTDALTLIVDSCPTKKQNYDYSQYLLTVLYLESWKTEAWEAEKQEDDMESYFWDIKQSKKTLVETIIRLKDLATQIEDKKSIPEYIHQLPESPTDEDIVNLPQVQSYKEAVTELHDNGEDELSTKNYKEATLKLLIAS